MRRFVIIGRTATASSDFSTEDLPSSSNRLDVLSRCVRAGLLISHGVRRDTMVYLVLLGGPEAPRTLRFDGAEARYLRPDERHLAITIKKALGSATSERGFTAVRPGIALANAGLDAVLEDLPPGDKYLLDVAGEDIRNARPGGSESTFFVGDHLGVDEGTRALFRALGVRSLSVGPLDVHAEDAVTLVCNELDRIATLPDAPSTRV